MQSIKRAVNILRIALFLPMLVVYEMISTGLSAAMSDWVEALVY
jgi:hypothetical protein